MPKNHQFWFPAHEAGHIVVATVLGITVEHAHLNLSGPSPYGLTEIDENMLQDNSETARIAAAGMAGEMLVYSTLPSPPSKPSMTAAMHDRASNDCGVFLQTAPAQFASMNQQRQLDTFLEFAQRNVANPILVPHAQFFQRVRDHLARYQFVGKQSLAALQAGRSLGIAELRPDYLGLPNKITAVVPRPPGV